MNISTMNCNRIEERKKHRYTHTNTTCHFLISLSVDLWRLNFPRQTCMHCGFFFYKTQTNLNFYKQFTGSGSNQGLHTHTQNHKIDTFRLFIYYRCALVTVQLIHLMTRLWRYNPELYLQQ